MTKGIKGKKKKPENSYQSELGSPRELIQNEASLRLG
jgi:hypothetical protein